MKRRVDPTHPENSPTLGNFFLFPPCTWKGHSIPFHLAPDLATKSAGRLLHRETG